MSSRPSFWSSTGDEAIYFEIEGIEAVQERLDELADDLQEKASLEMVSRVGEWVRYWMQQNVLQNFKLGTGKLFNSIFTTIMTTDEGAEVYVGPNVNDVPYALIQNFGGTTRPHVITPVNAKALHFQKDGRDIYTRRVNHPGSVIPARPYMEPAYMDHQDEIIFIMNAVLDEAITGELK
ncbi:MAG: hypothetical protein IJI07_01255 [Flexilinea sp.]|nr:hypothetical protein [Flexilinea sp.]